MTASVRQEELRVQWLNEITAFQAIYGDLLEQVPATGAVHMRPQAVAPAPTRGIFKRAYDMLRGTVAAATAGPATVILQPQHLYRTGLGDVWVIQNLKYVRDGNGNNVLDKIEVLELGQNTHFTFSVPKSNEDYTTMKVDDVRPYWVTVRSLANIEDVSKFHTCQKEQAQLLALKKNLVFGEPIDTASLFNIYVLAVGNTVRVESTEFPKQFPPLVIKIDDKLTTKVPSGNFNEKVVNFNGPLSPLTEINCKIIEIHVDKVRIAFKLDNGSEQYQMIDIREDSYFWRNIGLLQKNWFKKTTRLATIKTRRGGFVVPAKSKRRQRR